MVSYVLFKTCWCCLLYNSTYTYWFDTVTDETFQFNMEYITILNETNVIDEIIHEISVSSVQCQLCSLGLKKEYTELTTWHAKNMENKLKWKYNLWINETKINTVYNKFLLLHILQYGSCLHGKLILVELKSPNNVCSMRFLQPC